MLSLHFELSHSDQLMNFVMFINEKKQSSNSEKVKDANFGHVPLSFEQNLCTECTFQA